MGNDQHAGSKTILDQLFWTVQPSREMSPRAAAHVPREAVPAEVAPVSSQPAQPDAAIAAHSGHDPAAEEVRSADAAPDAAADAETTQPVPPALQDAMAEISRNKKARGEIDVLMNTLRGSLDKMEQHGKRADALVQNLLQHSRAGTIESAAEDMPEKRVGYG